MHVYLFREEYEEEDGRRTAGSDVNWGAHTFCQYVTEIIASPSSSTSTTIYLLPRALPFLPSHHHHQTGRHIWESGQRVPYCDLPSLLLPVDFRTSGSAPEDHKLPERARFKEHHHHTHFLSFVLYKRARAGKQVMWILHHVRLFSRHVD